MSGEDVARQPITDRRSSYIKWVESEGIPLIQGFLSPMSKRYRYAAGNASAGRRRASASKGRSRRTTLISARSRRSSVTGTWKSLFQQAPPRVDRDAVYAHLVVKMRAGAASGVADFGDLLPFAHLLSPVDVNL